MNNEQQQQQQQHAEERQLKLYEKVNQKLKNKIGELQLDFFAVSSELEITREEKNVLAEYLMELQEENAQLKNMVNVQNGADEPTETAPKKIEDAGTITGGTIKASDITGPVKEKEEPKPNRAQKRAAEKAEKKRA